MMKRLFFWNVLAMAAFVLPSNLLAQEVVEPIDSIWIDSVAVGYNDVDEVIEIVDTVYMDQGDMIIDSVLTETGEIVADSFRLSDGEKWKRSLPQYDMKEYDWVDICYNPKYAVVTKNGKKGLYDMMEHRNITEIIYRDLGFSKQTMAEDSTYISMFYATKGVKRGIVSVYEPTNDVVSIWMDNPDEVYSLEDCTTIDKRITKHVQKLLESFIKQQQMDNAQIVILDAKSGRLKSWVSLDANMEKEDAGKLLIHSCTASLTKPFHAVMALENGGLSLDSIYNGVSYRMGIKVFDSEIIHQAIFRGYRRSVAERKWREFTDSQNPSTNPFIMAVGYNSLIHNGTMIIPTMIADNVNVEEDVFTETNLVNLRDVLSINRFESPQLAWLSNMTNWLGYATTEYIYSEEDKEQISPVGMQIQFAGVFPVDRPRYTICVVANKLSTDVTPAVLQDVVNPLTKWLLKN